MRLFVVSTVRRQHTRHLRATSPTRHRFKQIICGGAIRLVRNRAMPLREDLFHAYREQLAEQQRCGILEVHLDSSTGPKFDFSGDMPATEKVDDDSSNKAEAPQAPAPEMEDDGDDGDDGSEEEPAEEEEVEDLKGELGQPDMSWTKTDLVEHVADLLGEPAEELDKLTKREILARLP